MADRLRPVVLVAAVVIGLLAAFPHLIVPADSATRVSAAVQPLPGRGLGACAPGAQRCDPSAPASSNSGPSWTGLTIVGAGLALVVAVRRIRWRSSTPSLARGVVLAIDRPPRIVVSAL